MKTGAIITTIAGVVVIGGGGYMVYNHYQEEPQPTTQIKKVSVKSTNKKVKLADKDKTAKKNQMSSEKLASSDKTDAVMSTKMDSQSSESTLSQEESSTITTTSESTKEESATDTTTVADLSDVQKQALAILGTPAGFDSDYGNFTVDTLLAGQSDVTSNAVNVNDFTDKITNVTFNGVRIEQQGAKNLVRLNNVPADVDNITYIEGYFTFDGDNIVYKNQGTRIQGAEQDANAQMVGTQSLSALYEQYKDSDEFNTVTSLITQ